MARKRLLKTLIVTSICAMMMVGVTGCSMPGSDSGKDETKIEESDSKKDKEDKDDKEDKKDKDDKKDKESKSEGYESSEDVINAFWKAMKNVDEDGIAACFYSKADAEDDIESNYKLAQSIEDNTTIHTKDIEFELEDDGDDAEDIVKGYGYKKFDGAETYTVTVPLTQDIDGSIYEVNDIYSMTTVCYDDAWYIVEMKEIDAVITNQPDIDEDKPGNNKPDSHVTNVDGFSDTYADKNNRSFAINGKLYTLGETTLQELIDDGVVFEDDSNAHNNIKPNYRSESFEIPLNDDEYYYCMVEVSNFTDENQTIADCPITYIYMRVKSDVKFVENTIEFAFPLDMTEDELRANSGDPSDYDDYESDTSDFYTHTLEYEWDNSKYIGSSGYRFEFQNGTFYYITMDYEP